MTRHNTEAFLRDCPKYLDGSSIVARVVREDLHAGDLDGSDPHIVDLRQRHPMEVTRG